MKLIVIMEQTSQAAPSGNDHVGTACQLLLSATDILNGWIPVPGAANVRLEQVQFMDAPVHCAPAAACHRNAF